MTHKVRHCCEAMTAAVDYVCPDHPDRYACPDCLIGYAATSRDYGILVHDGGTSSVAISYCPWCGTNLI